MHDLRSSSSGRQVHSQVIPMSLKLHNFEKWTTGAFARSGLTFPIVSSAIYDACRPRKHPVHQCTCATLLHSLDLLLFATTLTYVYRYI